MNNALCNGLIKNNNPKSPIKFFELVTLREYNDYSGGTYIDQVRSIEQFLADELNAVDEPFYKIYGKSSIDESCSSRFLLGEFYTIDKAKEFIFNLTGEIPDIICY